MPPQKFIHFVPQSLLYERQARRQRWFRDEDYNFPAIAAGAAKIVQAGGRVGVGSHGELQGLGFHWEMQAFAKGMRNHDVLRAEAIGYSQDLGSLAAGGLADLLVLDQDPLVNIRHTNSIRYVMKNGELFEGDTLRQVWPEGKAEPVFWWQKERTTKRQ
jgi:imidazolonepropionase-like amidohydrolase